MAGSKLQRFSVEMVPTPSIPDNVTHFQVFEDDQHILAFMANVGIFENQIVEEQDHDDTG